MHKSVQRAWIVVAFIAAPFFSASGQSLKALLINSASPTRTQSSFSTDQDTVSPFTFSSSFRKNPLIVIKNDDQIADKISLEQKIFSVRSALELFESRDTNIPDTEAYKNQSAIEVFYDSLDEELHEDPFYHIGRDTSKDKFIYEEQVWDALADTLRKKSRIFRAIDDKVAQAEDMITLKYETQSQIVLRAKPGIEQVGAQRYPLLRLGLRLGRYSTDVDTRVSENGVKVHVGKKLNKSDRPSILSIEHESTKSEYDKTKGQWEQKSQVCLKVPVW